jgi:hypothetical protein
VPTKAEKQVKTSRALKISELCRIIKTCRKHGVDSITIGEVHLEFAVSPQRNGEPKSESTSAGPPQTQISVPIQDPRAHINPKSMFTPQDKELMMDLERSQLLIDDPEAFEQVMISEDLENGRVNSNAEAHDS